MSDSQLAIAGFYDHESETERHADWGGDDLFAAPAPRRRRFERSGAHHPVRLRDERHEPAHEVHAMPEPRVQLPEPPVEPEVLPRDEYMEPVPVNGRRTVTITGRPESFAPSRRPARTIDERIMHRPERIASWTCSLGALSILLAIITAQ